MKKTILSAICGLLGCLAVADEYDTTVVFFKFGGTDSYANGSTPVADGEQYAVVWAANGYPFAGFNLDGTLVDTAHNELVTKHPAFRAQAGRVVTMGCAVARAKLSTGRFFLALLDTRTFGETASVGGSVQSSTLVAETSGATPETRSLEGAARVASASVLPLEVESQTPQIVAMDFDGDDVVLKVINTDARLNYNVAAGTEPGAVDAPAAATSPKTGGAETIELRVPRDKGGNSQFFRVTRNPL